MRPVDTYIKKQLIEHLEKLENLLSSDVLAILSPIIPGLENVVRFAIESLPSRKASIAIIIDTPGGVVEVIERMVDTIRKHYSEVIFIIPNKAMSAGTVFVMSGDRILMNYFSRLGPIDPQIEKDGKFIPALSYLNQFDRLNQKAMAGQLTQADMILLNKLDLAELHQFEQARDLSRELLIKWLSNYKFKNWTITETRKLPVTAQIRKETAEKIADCLSNNEMWHSHGRGIGMDTLQGSSIKLLIEDFDNTPELSDAIRDYFELVQDYMSREKLGSFVNNKEFF